MGYEWITELNFNISVATFMKACTANRCLIIDQDTHEFRSVEKAAAIEMDDLYILGIGTINQMPVLYI